MRDYFSRIYSIQPGLSLQRIGKPSVMTMPEAYILQALLTKVTNESDAERDTIVVRVAMEQTQQVDLMELANPSAYNSEDSQMLQNIRDSSTLLLASQNLSKATVLVLQGAGEHFCVGGNPYQKTSGPRGSAQVACDIFREF